MKGLLTRSGLVNSERLRREPVFDGAVTAQSHLRRHEIALKGK
jgi:hypothetical protein